MRAATGKLSHPIATRDHVRLHSRAVVRVGVGVGCVVGLTVLLSLASLHTFSGNSDGATVVLEGQAISEGHVTLHGWAMSLDSFWTIDALFYALAIRLVGLRADLLHVVPAVIAACVVIVGARLARAANPGGRPGLLGAAVVVAMLGLPNPDLGYFFLQGPWHIGTTLWCLVAFMTLSDARFNWRWGIGVVFLAAGLLGDFSTLAFGIMPMLLGGLASMARHRSWRAGVAAVVAVPASIVLALLVRLAASAVGTFSIVNRNLPVNGTQVLWNLKHLPTLLSGLLGVGTLQVGVGSGPRVLQVVHVVTIALVVFAIVASAANLCRAVVRPTTNERCVVSDRFVDDLLLFGFIADLATFALASPTWNVNNVRYLIPAALYGAILAGRSVSRFGDRLGGRRQWKFAFALASIVVFAFSADFASYFAAAPSPEPVQQLAGFLEAHNLTEGIGDYWSASLVTVKSADAVVIRPVTNNAKGTLLRYDRQSSVTWYAGQEFQFFVYDTARPFRQVNSTTATATFGRPTKTFDVGTYRVLVWNHGLELSPALPAQPDPLKISWKL